MDFHAAEDKIGPRWSDKYQGGLIGPTPPRWSERYNVGRRGTKVVLEVPRWSERYLGGLRSIKVV